jgi:predicted RNA-binding protein associated with RNAse of E/G family
MFQEQGIKQQYFINNIMQISLNKLLELYVDTLNKCGTYLLAGDDETILYNIFEEFDIGIVSFLHEDSLTKLLEGGLISKNEMEEAINIRKKTLELQEKNEWNIDFFRTSENWRELLNLCDEINKIRNSS